jgi:hypothetical protein
MTVDVVGELIARLEAAENELARRNSVGFGGVSQNSDLQHWLTVMSDLLGAVGCESPTDAARRVVTERDAARRELEVALALLSARDRAPRPTPTGYPGRGSPRSLP